MVFSSLPFLFVFLPVFFLAYGFAPRRWKNLILFLGSVGFYTYGALETPHYIALLLLTILVNWGIGKKMAFGRPRRKLWLTVGLVYDFFWLLLFKYAGFFFDNGAALWNLATGDSVSRSWSLILPIGISFYTFQIVSYLIDVYRETVAPARSFVDLGAYLCMFPQLIAGPIVQYNQVAAELEERSTSLSAIDRGLRTFVLGLGSKVLLANRIGSLWTDVQAAGFDSLSTPVAWMAAAAYSFQLYFDFFGYSLMAVGLGQMMGFDLPENFRDPYQSVSMTEFWRRWHITLGSWFREYVYIPLGGNRGGGAKTVRNLLIVWLLTGFWHGASWNFVLWGLLLFVLLVIERAGLRAFFEKHRWLGHGYMILLIPLSWMLFAITDFSQLGVFFSRLFPLDGQFWGLYAQDWLDYGRTYGWLLALGLLFSTPLPKKLWHKLEKSPLRWLTVPVLLAIFWGAVYCLFKGLNDPFLYFRF
ncbi:MAG: MBOAT family protein [Clostridia bacterium]|nr:MBOAT family protein [Clostridia bacterium]